MIADDNNTSCKFRTAMSVIYIVYKYVCCHGMQGPPSSFEWKTLLHNSIMCRNLDFLNLQHLFLAGTFKQFTWAGASNFHWRRIWSFKQVTADTNYCTVILPKSVNIKQVLICDWLTTWLSTFTQSSQTEYSAMYWDVQAVQSEVRTEWRKDRTCPGISFFFWAAQFLLSWPMFLWTALLF